MRKSRWFSPYAKPGKTNLKPAKARSGVYLIRRNFPTDEKPVILYIGMSQTDLYKTITRHFQKWEDDSQVRVTYPQTADYQIRIIFCTPRQAVKLEEALRANYLPKDNPQPLPYDWEVTDGHTNVYTAFLDCDQITREDLEPYEAPF